MDNRFYNDGTPIVLMLGDHGLGPKFPEYENGGLVRLYQEHEILQAKATPLYLLPATSVDPTSKEYVASRQERGSQDFCSFDEEPIVEFISFGRSHRYYARHYPLVADYWRDNLFTEARILARSLQGEQAIAYEFLEGDGSLGAWMTHGIRNVADVFRRTPIPKPADYDPLMRRVWQESDKLKAATSADYALMHEVGLEFMRIRYEQAKLTKRIRKRLEELIEAAEWGEKGATEVENTAFAVLDLYGQARYSADPAALAAYRCGVLMVRAGARYIGEKVADNSTRKALWEAGVIIRGELPKIVSGLIQAYMKKRFKNPKNPSLSERFAEETVGLSIWAVFFTVDFYVFETAKLSPAQQAKAGELYFEKLAPELATQIVTSLTKIGLGHKIDKLAEDSTERIWLERLQAALPALIGAVIKEYGAMSRRSKEEKRPFYEVFCAEAGWALVRIFKAVGMALLEAPVQKAMQRKMESDKQFLDKTNWKAIILSIRLQLAELNPDFMKNSTAAPVAWNQTVPKLKPGPDENGNVGINKLKPAPAPPNPIKKTNPPKPSKKERKRVKLDKTKDIRKGKEFTKAEKEAKLKSNAEDVKRKWPDDFKGKGSHYMCDNCGFVHSKKSMFQVDHVLDIQHGGDKNRNTKEELERLATSVDPKLLYEKGDNSAVLCGGCNGAKNTKFNNPGGFVPKGKGYAYTKKDEDMNPQHIYQGGPGD